jgi:hypothetical protein
MSDKVTLFWRTRDFNEWLIRTELIDRRTGTYIKATILRNTREVSMAHVCVAKANCVEIYEQLAIERAIELLPTQLIQTSEANSELQRVT